MFNASLNLARLARISDQRPLGLVHQAAPVGHLGPRTGARLDRPAAMVVARASWGMEQHEEL